MAPEQKLPKCSPPEPSSSPTGVSQDDDDDQFHWVEKFTPTHVNDLCRLYSQEWWTRDRSPADINRMVARADYLFGMVDSSNNKLVGFCRVVTDHVFKALIFDVMIDPL